MKFFILTLVGDDNEDGPALREVMAIGGKTAETAVAECERGAL